MPYDNDLGVYAEAVMERIQAGTVGGVEAAIMADLPGEGGMNLVTLAEGIARPYPDPALEASASVSSLDLFLQQAAAIYEARRYAVVILDHGGSLERVRRLGQRGQQQRSQRVHVLGQRGHRQRSQRGLRPLTSGLELSGAEPQSRLAIALFG